MPAMCPGCCQPTTEGDSKRTRVHGAGGCSWNCSQLVAHKEKSLKQREIFMSHLQPIGEREALAMFF